jgi:hypothetical protein
LGGGTADPGQAVEQAADCILQMQKKDFEPARSAFLEGYLAQQKGQLQEAAAFW